MLKKVLAFSWLLLAMANFALLQELPDSSKIPVPGYRLFWHDEFDGPKLDMKKWDYRSLGPRRDAINVKQTVALDGRGHLILTTERHGNQIWTAMIGTENRFETTFGYFECRVKLQKEVGHWSAFWLQSPTMGEPVGNPAKAGTEIDIFEYLRREGDHIRHAVHWDGYQKNHRSKGVTASVPGLMHGWHTIGLLWTPTAYTFFVDGKKTWVFDQAVSKRPEYLILSLEVGKWGGDIARAQLPDSFWVDYVRVYKPIAGNYNFTQNSADAKPRSLFQRVGQFLRGIFGSGKK